MPVFETQIVVSNYLDVSSTEPSNPVHGQKWMDGTIMKTWDDTLKEWVLEDLKGESSSLWIRYADDDKGNGFSASPANKKFVAMKTAINNPVPSEDPADYQGLWAKFMGPEGESIEGPPGKDGQPTYTWIRYADNVSGGGISANPEGKMYIGFAYNKPTPEPSGDPKDYAWSAMYDEAKMLELQEQLNGMNYVGTNLWAPEFFEKKGNTSYIGVDGELLPSTNFLNSDFIKVGNQSELQLTIFENSANAPKIRVGTYRADGTHITRLRIVDQDVGVTGTLKLPAGTESIRFDCPNPKKKGGKIKVELGNKATDYSISPLDTPTTGDLSNMQTELQNRLDTIVMPVTQPSAPTNPKEGMVWWQNNLAGEIIGMFKYEKGKWEPQTIQQSMLNIIELNAVRITGSTITGSDIFGAKFINNFKYKQNEGTPIEWTVSGITDIEGKITMDWFVEGADYNGRMVISPEGIYGSYYSDTARNKMTGYWNLHSNGFEMSTGNRATNNFKSASYMSSGIMMVDQTKKFGSVNLGYNDLINIPLKNMTPYFSQGWDAYSTEYYPQIYRAGKNVQIFGAMKPTVEVHGQIVWHTIMTLPPEYRPLGHISTAQQGSRYNTFAFQILKTGEVQVSRHRNRDQDGVPFATTAWVNISFSYITA